MEVKSKVELRVSIYHKKSNNTFYMSNSYTMLEHFNGKHINDAKIYVAQLDGVHWVDIITLCEAGVSSTFEEAILRELNLPKSHLPINKVHNPMQSDFNGFDRYIVNGVSVLIKTLTGGVKYAVFNHAWGEEIGVPIAA